MPNPFLVLAILSLACAVGCGSGGTHGRKTVEGSVSYGGQPVEEGQIVFEPTLPDQPIAGAKIQSGAYRIEAKDGPAPGLYRVRIEGYRKKKVPNMPPHPYLGDDQEPGVVSEQFIPVDYNSRSRLSAEITEEGENTHDFDLPARR